MYLKTFSCLALCFFILASCGKSSSGSKAMSGVTAATMSSTPQITDSIATTAMTPLNQIEEFFKLECHLYDHLTDDQEANLAEIRRQGTKDNFCPEGILLTGRNKLSSSLIGYVYHAVMYASNIYGTGGQYVNCGAGSNPQETNNHQPVYTVNGTESTDNDYIINIPGIYDCVSTFRYGGSESYSTYHKAEDGQKFAIVTTNKEQTSSEYPDETVSNVYQMYASQTDAQGTPQLIASNLVSYVEKTDSEHGLRAIIITNTSNNKFVAKYHQSTGDYLVALGKAGIKPDGTWVEGNYYVKSHTSLDTKFKCIENGPNPRVIDDSECNDILTTLGVAADTDWTAADIEGHLGLAGADLTYLSNFIDVLNNSNQLDPSQVPDDHSNFPNTITAE